MTIDEFLKKYNRCPHCEHYTTQGHVCSECKWEFPTTYDRHSDNFSPTDVWMRNLNREVEYE